MVFRAHHVTESLWGTDTLDQGKWVKIFVGGDCESYLLTNVHGYEWEWETTEVWIYVFCA